MCQGRPTIETEGVNPQADNLKSKGPWDSQSLDMGLLQASESGDVEVADKLIRQGANVNGSDATGKTPLHIAAFRGHTRLASSLLTAGADCKAKDQLGKTPLHHAASRAHLDIAKELILAGCDATAKDKWGKTAMHLLAEWKAGAEQSAQGHVMIVHELIGAGASPDELDNQVVSAVDEQGKSPLHTIAQRGQAEIATAMVLGGADVSVEDHEGKTALHHAAKCIEPGVVRVLVESGAKVDTKDKLGKTALHGASRSATLALLDKGADCDSVDANGRTALHEAAATANTDVVGALVNAGANVNVKDGRGCTPLDEALRSREACKRRDQGQGGRSVQALLKLHGGVPGKRSAACFRIF